MNIDASENLDIWVNQSQLAELFDVSRGTITNLQRKGLPFEPNGPQKSNRYNLAFSIHWFAGRGAFESREKSVTPENAGLVAAVAFLTLEDSIELAARVLCAGLGCSNEKATAIAHQARGWWFAEKGRVPALEDLNCRRY